MDVNNHCTYRTMMVSISLMRATRGLDLVLMVMVMEHVGGLRHDLVNERFSGEWFHHTEAQHKSMVK